MTGITYFVALPFDVADGSVVIGEPVECPSPAAAIERAQGLWSVLGHPIGCSAGHQEPGGGHPPVGAWVGAAGGKVKQQRPSRSAPATTTGNPVAGQFRE